MTTVTLGGTAGGITVAPGCSGANFMFSLSQRFDLGGFFNTNISIVPFKQRHDFSRAELDQIEQAFPTIIANAIVDVFNGTD
jgi:hypothetical protein